MAALVACALGLYFRITHLDARIFWGDEAITALRISGHTEEDYKALFDGGLYRISEVLAYQKPDPSKRLLDVANSLASDEPQHPPIFYLMERLWTLAFGASIAVLRSLPALLSVLAVIGAAWLAWELFGSWQVVLVAASVLAVSPFQIIYAHEAREYSLWILVTLASSAWLLRAIYRNTTLAWAGYAALVAVGLYSDLLFAFVLLGHALYVAVAQPMPRMARVGFVSASLAAAAAFGPWIAVILRGRDMVVAQTSWVDVNYPPLQFLEKWAFNIGAQFFDLEYLGLRYLAIALPILAIAAYAALVFVRRANAQQRWFIVTMIAGTAVPLVLHDVLSGTIVSINARFLVPVWLGLDMAVAYGLASLAFAPTARNPVAWRAASVALLAAGVASAAVGSSAPAWYDNHRSAANAGIARVIESAQHPVVMCEHAWSFVLAISHYLDDGVRLQLYNDASNPKVPKGFKTIFAVAPTQTFRRALTQRGFKLSVAYQQPPIGAPVRHFRENVERLTSLHADPDVVPNYPDSLWFVERDRASRR